MNKKRAASLMLLAVATAGIMVGSLGVTSIYTGGSASVDIVSDDRAVEYRSSDSTARDGETIELVTVTNRAFGDLTVTNVTIIDGESVIAATAAPGTVPPGERATIRATVDCTPNQTQQIALTVTTTGSGITAQVSSYTETEEFTMRCTAAE